ncbi:hypothetical protein QYE76_000948 [Lolium multiflorum]|uniref:Nudix hydrolase domain-containing protein n=1 Tax=Lolium multiflorum TaxID=4521 RepID=A0AAD8RK97_LOLMU|nr:hypothetical protein QYE76_000948 [Lolium multiflorum]
MTVAAARCLILTPTISSTSSCSALLPFPRIARRRRRELSCSASPFASMDAPPEGYRTNVGICLADPSLTKAPASQPSYFPFIPTPSPADPLSSPAADFLRVQDRHPQRLADASVDFPGCFVPPQGGIDPGEEPRAAAVRELREETGVTSAEIVAEAPNWLTYDFPADVRDKLNARWGSNWKGQAQKWFLFRLTGSDDEINLMGDGSEKPEFSEWTWMTPKQVIEKAVEFKKPVYEETLKHFAPYLQSDPTTSS